MHSPGHLCASNEEGAGVWPNEFNQNYFSSKLPNFASLFSSYGVNYVHSLVKVSAPNGLYAFSNHVTFRGGVWHMCVFASGSRLAEVHGWTDAPTWERRSPPLPQHCAAAQMSNTHTAPQTNTSSALWCPSMLLLLSVVLDNLGPEAGSEDWRGAMGSPVSDWVAPQAPGFIHLHHQASLPAIAVSIGIVVR